MNRTPWKPRVTPILDGQLVNAEVANQPILDLSSQTKSLKGRLEDLSLTGGRLVLENAPLGIETAVGDFVYFDTSNETIRPACSDTYQDPLKGGMVAAETSRAIGMVISKEGADSGTVLFSGVVRLSELSLTLGNLLDDSDSSGFTSGPLYLSTRIPGRATPARVFPSIQLGFFSEDLCIISMQHKDLFESHEHYRFPLLTQPAASQNYALTGWTAFGQTGSGIKKRVDYYNSGADAVPPQIILCVRHSTAGAPIAEDSPVRVEIHNDSGMVVSIHSGSLAIEDPAGVADTTTTLPTVAWPAYGEWTAVEGTNLEFAFIRADNTYSHTLAYDAAALLTATTMRFKVFLPNDLAGWTNANTFDISHVPGSLYRYLIPHDEPLNSVFPPLPTSSALIELNGVSLTPSSDFVVTHLGIFWMIGTFDTTDVAPWPADYSVDPGATMVADNAKTLVISFIKSALGNMNSVVYSLKGIAPIRVVRCPDGTDAINGDLQVMIDLSLTTSPTTTPSETALASVSGVDFQRTTIVAELVEGPGVRIENITTGALLPGTNCGRVRISLRGLKFEGEMSSIALRNAKEMFAPAGTYIDFVPPSVAASGITASFKLPNYDLDPSQLKLRVVGAFRGDIDVPLSSAEQFAMFKATFHVVRRGFVMSAMNESNALAVQYWKVPFAPGYQSTAILGTEYPYQEDDLTKFEINSDTLVDFPGSLVATNGGFAAGDIVVVMLDRVTEDDNNNVANYQGRVGACGLRWFLL